MVDHIEATYGLGREDAYVLCSLAVDLKISEIVDAGQYIVSAVLPEAIFGLKRRCRDESVHVDADVADLASLASVD